MCATNSANGAATNSFESASNRIVKVGFFPFDGFNSIDSNGRRGGFGYDYLQHLRNYANWTYEYHSEQKNLNTMFQMLRDGKIDILPGVIKTPERESEFSFSESSIADGIATLAVKSGCNKFSYNDYKNWDGIRIGMLHDNLCEDFFKKFAEEKGFRFTKVYLDSPEQLTEELKKGKVIDAVLSSSMRRSNNELVYERLRFGTLYIATRKNEIDLLHDINYAQRRMLRDEPELEMILKKSYCSSEKTGLELLEKEEQNAVISAKTSGRTFSVVMNPDRRPFSWYENGSYHGFFKEYADAVSDYTGLKFVYVPTTSRQDYIAKCSDPNIDIVFDMPSDLYFAEKAGTRLSIPFFTASISLIKNKTTSAKIKKLAILEFSNFSQHIINVIPYNVETLMCGSISEMLDNVNSGICDAAYYYTWTFEDADFSGERNNLINISAPMMKNQFSIGIRNSISPAFLTIINKALSHLNGTVADSLYEKYSPKVKEVFSFRLLFTRHPIATLCALIVFILLISANYYKRQWIMIESLRRWSIAAKVAQIHPFRFNLHTKKPLGKWHNETSFWPLVNGIFSCAADFVLPDDLQTFSDEFSKLRSKKTKTITVSFRAKINDEIHWFRMFAQKDSINSAIISGIIQDISQDKKLEHERNTAQSLWEEIITAMPILVFIKSADDDFRYIHCNMHFANFVGKNQNEIVGHTDAEIFKRPQDAKCFQEWDRKIMESGEPQEFFEEANGANGNYFFQTMKMPFRDAEGKNLMIGLSIDITEFRKAQDERNAVMELWNRSIAAMPVIMYVKDINNKFKYTECNENFCRFFGRKKEFIIGHTDDEISNAISDSNLFTRNDLETIKNAKPMEFYETVCGADGKKHHFRAVKLPTKDVAGNPIIVGMSINITELIEERENARIAKLKLEEASKALKASAEMWNTVLDELPIRFFVKDTENGCRYLMCNKSNADFFGKTQQEIIGKTTYEIASKSHEIVNYIENEKQILESGCVNRTRISLADSVGIIHEMLKIEMPIMGPNGKTLLVGVAFDITEQEQSQRMTEITSRILSRLISENDFDKSLDFIGRTAIDILNNNRIIFAAFNNSNRLHCIRDIGSSADHKIHRHNNLLCEEIWLLFLEQLKRNEIVSFERLGDIPVLLPVVEANPDMSNISVVGTPVCKNGELHGLMIVVYDTPKHFTKIDFQTLRAIADCILLVENRSIQNMRLKKVREEQSRQLAERTAINKCLSIFLNSDYMHVPFEQILETIRHYLGASNCFVLHLDYVLQNQKCLAEAVISNGEALFINRPPVYFDSKASWINRLKNEKVFLVTNILKNEKWDDYGMDWKQIFDERGISSFWVADITPHGEMWGSLGITYDNHSERKYSAGDKSFVRAVSRIVSLILMRANNRDKLRSALDQAKTAEKAKSFFLASMSHEIRTPLNAVIGFTELLTSTELPPDIQKEYLADINFAGQSLLQLINDILDLSKLEADQMSITSEPVDLQKLCHECCHVFRRAVEEKNLSILVSALQMPLLMLDLQRLRQIIFNLVGNAVKFTKKGEIRLTATFKEKTNTEGMLKLTISDTGIGISEEDQKKLFEPFVQLKKMRGTCAANNGTGLGLVIVRKLVTKMGGTLTLESEEGKGSAFSIVFPAVMIAIEEIPDRISETNTLCINA